jgi:hypothetical protein
VEKVEGLDLIAIPEAYMAEFRRDPTDSMLKYGALPTRARSPFFTDPDKIEAASQLTNFLTGKLSVKRVHPQNADIEWFAAVAHPTEDSMLGAMNADLLQMRSDWREAAWHVHVDPGLNRGRKGDAAGLAIGRILDQAAVEVGTDYRVVNRFIVPIVMQIVAPEAGEIYLTSITRFILQVRGMLGINITSFSYDSFQSAGAIQELSGAGLVTAGMRWDDYGQRLEGLGKPFSVDRTVNAYQELKEAVNEGRILVPDYWPLRAEMERLEDIPGRAPDHPVGGSKDCSDAVAGVVGYLTQYGHSVTTSPYQATFSDNQQYLGQSEYDAIMKIAESLESDDPPAMLSLD